MSGFSIREYTKKDFGFLLRDEHFWNQPRLPITKCRVRSHLANPHSAENDVVLLTASNGRLLAYLGILPDHLRTDSGGLTKFGWLSTWWADPLEGGAAATLIFFKALGRYRNRIASSNFSAAAKQVFDKSQRFDEFAAFEVSHFILAAPPSWRISRPISRWAAKMRNSLIFSRMLDKHHLTLEIVQPTQCRLQAFLQRWTAAEPLPRRDSDWRWIQQFPWISESPEERESQKRYEFSVFANEFRQIPLVAYRRGTIIAFLFLTLREGRLSLKYAYYDPADLGDIVATLQSLIAEMNPWHFVSPDRVLSAALQRGFPFYLGVRHCCAAGYAHKALGAPHSEYQFGIGDTVFT